METGSSWGADASGIVAAYLFTPNQAAVPIDATDAQTILASQSMAAPEVDGRFVWLHVNLACGPALRWLQRHADLPEAFYLALQDNVRSTRVERDEDSLIAVVNDVLYEFAFDASDISTLWISLSSQLVVTARYAPLRSVDQMHARIKSGEQLRSTVDLLEHLLRAQADVLLGIVRDVTRRVDDIEDDLLAGKPRSKRVRLGSLRRMLVRLQRLLAPEPASMFRLLQHPPHWMNEHDVQELRQASEEFSVVLSDMASLQERIKLLQEEVAAAVNESNNKSLFVLTVLTVLALPINLTSGLFGMNVGGVPFNQDAHGFWVVVTLVGLVTGLATWAVLRGHKED